MSKSLIRKNQLHPDIADLISGYGNDFFITQEELEQNLNNLETGLNLGTVVYLTGNQSIGGVKTFTQRPIFNGSGLATTGELGGVTTFNGNRSITANVAGFQGQTPGGSDVVTFLNNLFYPFTQAIVTLNGFPLQELGTSITNIDFEGAINQGSLNFGADINNLTPFVNGTARTPIIPTPGSTFDFSVSFGSTFTNTVSNCYVTINSKNQNGSSTTINSNNLSIFFEAPIYAGSGELSLINNVTNMRNVLESQTNPSTNNGKYLIFEPSSRTVTVTTNGYYYFVYPESWGALSQIQDASLGFNFNINTDFVTNTFTFPLINNAGHLYRWYRNANQITLNNYGVKYIF